MSNLRKAFLNIKEVDIKKTLEQYFLSNLSYFEFNNEKSYQIVFGTIIAFLFEDATISFEANTGQGRSDIFIRTKKDNSLSIIIETKFLKGRRGRDRIDGSLEEGWNQINEMDYLEEANRIESKNILAYSVVFNNKKVYVSGKRIK